MRWWIVGFGLLALGGCQTARSIVPISLAPATLVSPTDPRLLTTHDTAVRGIAAMLAREFELPLPDRVTVYVYGSRQGFEEGLIHDAQLSPHRAAQLSEFAVGVGRPRQLLFRDDAADRGREWLRLVAHELAHVCQIELAGGEPGPAQWLKEGMAEWVAFSVLERLRLDSLAQRRERARASVRHSKALAAARLDIEGLGSPAGFIARHRRDGTLPTYQLAFLMVDHLVSRDGFPSVVSYFRAFTESRDRGGNFRRAFGRTVASFEQEFLAALAAQRP
jgi:hypothetical protein